MVSYHMGIGNLQNVLAAYGDDQAELRAGLLRLDARPPPAQLRPAQRLRRRLEDLPLAGARRRAGDATSTGTTAPSSRGSTRLHAAKASAEEVLHPRSETEVFEEPDDVKAAYDGGRARPFPDEPRRATGCVATGAWASSPSGSTTTRALSRAAPRGAGGSPSTSAGGCASWRARAAPLIVTSSVRDRPTRTSWPAATRRPRARTRSTPPALPSMSAAATARSARPARSSICWTASSPSNLIAWVREPGAIHITVSGEARRLLAGR